MNVTYDPRLKQDEKLFQLAQGAMNALQEVVGQPIISASASWDLGSEDGRPVAVLRLSDWAGEVKASFGLDESSLTRVLRLIRLWGDLLETRSRKQVNDLLLSSGAVPQLPVSR